MQNVTSKWRQYLGERRQNSICQSAQTGEPEIQTETCALDVSIHYTRKIR